MIKQNKVVVGADIVDLLHFKKAIKVGGQIFLDQIFAQTEQKKKDLTHLAGIFAAKEAAVKALGLKAGCWLEMEVVYSKNGKPNLRFRPELGKKIKTADLSISHDGNYAISIFLAILK